MGQWTATLEDGTKVTLEGDKQPSEQDFLEAFEQHQQQPQVSRRRAFLEHAATGVAPGAAFMEAFPTGARVGAIAGAAVPGAGETGISEAIGAGIGGLLSGSAAAWAAHKAQTKGIEAIAPGFAKTLESELAAGEAQHPYASVAGEVASLSPSAQVMAPFKAAQLPLRLAMGAGISAGMPLLQGRRPTLPDVLGGAVTTGLYGEGRFPAPFKKGAAYARSVQEAAKVHGNLLPPSASREGKVPAEVSGAGVQPQAEGGLAQGAQIPLKPKGPLWMRDVRGEVGEDERGWFVQLGERRQYGFATVFEAKKFLDGLMTGQHTIVGELHPEDNPVAGATYTDPETGETTLGPHHPGAAEEQDVDAGGPRESREGPEFGFVTEDGTTLTRPETEQHATETGQAMPEVQQKPGVPHSDEVKASGTEAPISETSDLDQIMEKIERGQKLTPAEEALFDAQINSPGTKPKVKADKHQIEFALEKEGNKVKKKIEIRDKPENPDDTVPFASNIAYIDRKSGRLVINRQAFNDAIAKIPQRDHSRWIERLINEEHLHSLTSDEDAQLFHANATAAERALAFRQYTGFADNNELFRVRGTRITDTLLGHEMVRQRLQQMSGLGTREIVELSSQEGWSSKFIDALQRLIFRLRKALGTRASRMQQDILNRMQGNLDAVKQSRGEPPGAFLRRAPEEQPEYLRTFITDLMKGRAKTTNDANAAGMKMRSVEDLADLGALRDSEHANMRQAISQGNPAEAMFHGMRGQYAREAIETAANVGSNGPMIEERMQLGPRPLDWKENPDVADWLRQNGQRLGIGLPDELKAPEVPGAFKRESKKEREVRQARERATEALPGFGGPAYSEIIKKAGEAPPPPPETLAERQQTGFEGVTPKWLEGDVRQYFDRTDAPSFKDWVEDLNARGIHVEPYQMGSVYEDATAKHLDTASGEKLTKMAKGLGVDVSIISRRAKKEGKRVLTNVPDPPDVERERMFQAATEGKPREQTASGELGVGDLSKEDLKDIKKQREGRERFRNRVIAAIWSKMVSEILPPSKALRRDSLDLEDIAWSDKKASEGPFYQFTNQEANDPAMVRAIAGDQSRRSDKENETISRRVLVLVDKNTGKVEEASVYRKGKDLMVMRPTIAGISGHRKLTDLPKSLRPVYTLLLGEPVQEYHKSYKSIKDFNEHWDVEEAKRRNTVAEFAFAAGEEPSASFALPAELDVERTPSEELGTEEVTMRPATQAEGGRMFVAPSGKYGQQGEFLQRAGEIGRAEDFPLQLHEASALFRVAAENEVSEPEDFKLMVDIMAERQRQKQGLRGDQASALSALHKIVAVTLKDLQESWEDEAAEMKLLKKPFDVPPPTPKDAYEVALKDVFHTVTKSKGFSDFLQTVLGDYRREARPDVQLTAPEAVPTTGAEGIQREVGLRGPTAQTPLGAPAGPRLTRPPGRFPLAPTPGEPLARPTEMLTPEERARVEWEAAQGGEGSGKELPSWYRKTLLAQLAHRQVPKEPYTVTEPGRPRPLPPGFRKPTPSNLPGAFLRKSVDAGEEAINQASRGVVALVKRNAALDEIAATRDKASNDSNNFANQIGNFLRMLAGARAPKGIGEALAGKVWHGDPDMKAAAIGRIQLGDPDAIGDARNKVQQGRLNAQGMIRTGDWSERIIGRRWLEYQNKLDRELDYLEKNWDNPELVKLAEAAHAQLDAQYQREIKAGHKVKYDPNYVPGRYEAEFWNDNAVIFGALHDVLGRNWKAPKTFRDYYVASSEEPYLAKSRDVADLVEHRVRQGMSRINYDNWVNGLKNIRDESSGKMVAANMLKRPDGSLAVPSPEYVGMPLRRGYQWIAIRKGFEPLIHDLTNQSYFEKNPWAHNALSLAQALKHTMLIGDVFHLGRVIYYGQSLAGFKQLGRYGGGLTAIEYRPQDLPEAVKRGLVSPRDARWAQERINVKSSGHNINMSRIQIADLLQRHGLNNGRILDAIYKETVGWVPGIGRYNRWLFDKATRGFITQSAVQNFERLNAKNPNLDAAVLARDVAKDVNNYFGNIGRQGWFKSATFRDMARLTFLAPQWVEGLVKKEVGFYSRVAGAPFKTRGELPQLGALGTGIGSGLLAMIAATQAINLLSRGKPTWENDEKGHKFDAFIPTDAHNPDEGFWFSPLSVFNELSHDVIRLAETKPKAWDVLSQIGENKLSPYGRIAMIGIRSRTPTGQYLTTTPSVMGAMGQQLLPTPISASKPLQMLGHAIAPGTIPQVRKGSLVRQLAATAGFKIEPSTAPAQQAHALADQFMLDNPQYKKDSGWQQVQTDEPNYSKLRTAIRNGDDAQALKQFEALRKSRSTHDIMKAMRLAAKRPFTGSHANERRFLYTLSPAQLDLYSRAQQQRQEEYESFLEWLSRSDVQ